MFIIFLGNSLYKGIEGTELREDIDYSLGIKKPQFPIDNVNTVTDDSEKKVVDSAELQLQSKLDELKQKYPYPAPNESSNIDTEKKYSFVIIETKDQYTGEKGKIKTGVFETLPIISEDEKYKLLDEAQTKSGYLLVGRKIINRQLKSYNSYAEASKAREKL